MTLNSDDPTDVDMSAVARTARIENLFISICSTLDEMIVGFGTADGSAPKSFNLKVGELQSAHVSLIKAHEVFCEKFSTTDTDSGIDYDAVRGDIGRQLDRIRAALDTE